MKRWLRRQIAEHEVTFWMVTLALYAVAIPVTAWLFPNISNLALSILILFSGLTATLGSMASALKTKDPE